MFRSPSALKKRRVRIASVTRFPCVQAFHPSRLDERCPDFRSRVPISPSRDLHIPPLGCLFLICSPKYFGGKWTRRNHVWVSSLIGTMADVIIGTHDGTAWCRRKVYVARLMVEKISIEGRHPWRPPNVACEILHVVPSGRCRDCLRVAHLQSLAPSAFLTAGSQEHKGPSTFFPPIVCPYDAWEIPRVFSYVTFSDSYRGE